VSSKEPASNEGSSIPSNPEADKTEEVVEKPKRKRATRKRKTEATTDEAVEEVKAGVAEKPVSKLVKSRARKPRVVKDKVEPVSAETVAGSSIDPATETVENVKAVETPTNEAQPDAALEADKPRRRGWWSRV
jgi:ribonuclease E